MYNNPEVFKFAIPCNRKLQGTVTLNLPLYDVIQIFESFTYISYTAVSNSGCV